jgi:hypothetical protein
MNKVKQFLITGVPIGRIALFFLAGGIPIAPFSFWGYGAVNLMAAGAMGWTALKAVLQLAMVLANKIVGAYYPNLWWVGWLLVLNPWYVFDLVQLFSPAFPTEGFKVPFYGASIRPTDGVYRINAIVLGLMLGLVTLGGFSLISYLPPQIVGAARPTLELIFKVIGGIAAVTSGGVGMLVLPKLFSSIRNDASQISTAIATPTPAVASGPSAPLTQKGGAGQGSVIPSLRDVAAGMLGPDPRGDPGSYRSQVITGGGRKAAGGPSKTDSMLFVSILGMSALAGLALAVVRSKGDSAA